MSKDIGPARLRAVQVASITLAALLLVACHTPARAPKTLSEPAVIPVPAQIARNEGSFMLRAGARVATPPDLNAAGTGSYFIELLARSRGLTLLPSDDPQAAAVLFQLDSSGRRKWGLESYEIDVAPGRITVTAGESAGLFYGAVTLWQLCTQETSRTDAIRLPSLHINDTPRFPWRGLMLDSARHYQPPELIMEFIDWMALHKLNVLHWHLTDDQGWRLEIKKYPRLTSVGAWRVPAGHAAAADIDPATHQPRLYGGYYSQETVRQIVAHAAARHVRVVPEIDLPGHATAAIVAYPWLGATLVPPKAVPADWGIYPNLFNVEERTFDFLDEVLDEVTALFPGQYIHVGGDEAVKDQWKASSQVQARMRELGVPSEEALQGYFMQRIEKHLASRGRSLIGWDEIVDGGLPAQATVMSWRGIQGAVSAAKSGHDTVLAADPTLYFNNRYGTRPDEPPGRGRVVSLEEVYRFEPVPEALSAADGLHVLGLQANLWTEQIRTTEQLGYRSFPRAAAVAEIGWSLPFRRSWEGFEARLPAQLARYRALGIPHAGESPRVQRVAGRRMSQELKTCTEKLVLSLEDDAPLTGPRAVFLVDIMNPCWLYESADLSGGPTLQAAVGQLPFNFQLGHDVESIHLLPPRTAAGELEVRVDGCSGEPIAVLPLDPAVMNDAVTELPAVSLPRRSGRHDLCLMFTQRTLDPLWAIDWVQVR
jgi:hexosaminidase